LLNSNLLQAIADRSGCRRQGAFQPWAYRNSPAEALSIDEHLRDALPDAAAWISIPIRKSPAQPLPINVVAGSLAAASEDCARLLVGPEIIGAVDRQQLGQPRARAIDS